MKSVFSPLIAEIGGNVASTKANVKANGTCFVALSFPGLSHDVLRWWKEGPGHIPLVLSASLVGQGDHRTQDFFFSWGQISMSGRKIPLLTEEIWLTLRKGKIWAFTVCPETCLVPQRNISKSTGPGCREGREEQDWGWVIAATMLFNF